MAKQFLILSFLIVGMIAASAPGQSLVPIDPATVTDGHVYLMDNVAADVPDESANDIVGTPVGAPAVVEGLNGAALQFDGTDDGVNIPDSQFINVTGGPFGTRTAIAVFKCDDVDNPGKQTIFEEGGTTRGSNFYVSEGLLYTAAWNRAEYNWNGEWLSTPIESNTWYAVAMVIRNGGEAVQDDRFEMWLNGELIAKAPGGHLHNHGDNNAIGYTRQNTVFHDGNASPADGHYFGGAIDEVWILNVALSEAELASIAPTSATASEPTPANDATDVLRDGIFAWMPGEFAQTHDVYLGASLDDVNNASRDNPMEVLVSQGQTDATFDPGRLEFGQMYYWRVDEVNGAPDNTIFKGDVWSFEVEPLAIPIENITVMASSTDPGVVPENTINGSGLDEDNLHSAEAPDMWVSDAAAALPATLTYQFDRAHKIHEMLVWNYNVQFEAFLGYGFKDVTVEYTEDGTDWIVLGDFEFAQGTSEPAYAANTAIDFGGVTVTGVRLTANSNWGGAFPQTGLSEVRFLSIPVLAREPQPADGQTNVTVDSTLAWRAGREAATHEVLLAADPNALVLIDSVADNALDPGPLDLATTYYWQVVEVNEAETPTTWAGDLWSFSTVEFIVVDDFEDYDDEENLIFEVWIDGFTNDTGSTVGYFESPFAEQTITHGGGQSMPLAYDNTGGFTVSEATRTFDTPQDWTLNAVRGLVIWFYGDPTNDAAQMYVKIDDAKVLYDGDAENLARAPWQMWYIDLTGMNVSNVRELTIGMEGSGAGMIFVDDIMLSPYERQQVTPTEPDLAGLVSHFAFDGDTSDSTGAHPGTAVGSPVFLDGKIGQSISLNGTGDYVELTGYQGILGASAITVTAWVKTTSTVTGAIIGWGPNVEGQRFGFRIDAGRIRHEHHGGNIQGDTVMNDGTWHHVAITVQANATVSYPEATLWLDGLDDTRPTTDPDPYNIVADLDVRIGSRPAADDRLFMGEIDELYIYDRALSQAEIAYLAGRTQPFDVE